MQSGFSILWDITEFVALCTRRGYGIAPKAHQWVELVLAFFCGGSIAGAWVQKGSPLTTPEHQPAVAAVLSFFVLLR